MRLKCRNRATRCICDYCVYSNFIFFQRHDSVEHFKKLYEKLCVGDKGFYHHILRKDLLCCDHRPVT